MRERRPSQTALATCFARAAERHLPEAGRIVDDPFSEPFLPPAWRALLRAYRRAGRVPDRLSGGLAGVVLARHRAIDEALLGAARGGLDQVVLLGAGYDTRAWRFADALRGARVFEVDHPATSARKARIVARQRWPAVDRVRVPVDFERDDPRARLAEAGFREGARTFWAWEGVSMYLRRPAVEATLALVRSTSAPGSVLAMDLWYAAAERNLFWRAAPELLRLVGEPITFSMPPAEVGGFLGEAGFELVEVAEPPELARRYVRDGRRLFPWLYVVSARVR